MDCEVGGCDSEEDGVVRFVSTVWIDSVDDVVGGCDFASLTLASWY